MLYSCPCQWRLTLPSRGTSKSYRSWPPLMSNVSPSHNESTARRVLMRPRYLLFVAMCAFVSGCVGLARYDDNTYKSITALKGEVKVFMDDCGTKGASGDKAATSLDGFRVKLSQSYEYEAGKSSNSETISQMKTLSSLFNEAYDRYSKNKIAGDLCVEKASTEPANVSSGCLSKGYCSGKSKVMETAFDIAISTEALKNK
jgi:hypothetical protein